jgi:glycine dehydrogenase subunit 1
MARYFPHTGEEVRQMLEVLGSSRVEELFSDIPEDIRSTASLKLSSGLAEYRVEKELSRLSEMNRTGKVCFLGCGAYDHVIPAVVSALASRGEYLTSYTPYQPEISQGVLQTIFEFQTMMAELAGLEVSNASLYDGATAAAEAAVMALNSSAKADTILYAEGLHPAIKQVLATFFYDQPVKLEELPFQAGLVDLKVLSTRLDETVAGVLVQSPNIYGLIEPVGEVSRLAHEAGALSLVSTNPLSLGLLTPPGEMGADIAVGDTQPLGLPLNYGGPSAGFIAATKPLLRKLPGRIVGETVDTRGRRAYVLTLQAREQHIKRQRATSNICSNQALAAVMNTVYLAAVGPEGLKEAALQSSAKARYLSRKLSDLFSAPVVGGENFFNEFTLDLPFPAADLIRFLGDRGVLAGVDLKKLQTGKPGNLLTVAVTEKRTLEELDRYLAEAAAFMNHREEKRG